MGLENIESQICSDAVGPVSPKIITTPLAVTQPHTMTILCTPRLGSDKPSVPHVAIAGSPYVSSISPAKLSGSTPGSPTITLGSLDLSPSITMSEDPTDGFSTDKIPSCFYGQTTIVSPRSYVFPIAPEDAKLNAENAAKGVTTHYVGNEYYATTSVRAKEMLKSAIGGSVGKGETINTCTVTHDPQKPITASVNYREFVKGIKDFRNGKDTSNLSRRNQQFVNAMQFTRADYNIPEMQGCNPVTSDIDGNPRGTTSPLIMVALPNFELNLPTVEKLNRDFALNGMENVSGIRHQPYSVLCCCAECLEMYKIINKNGGRFPEYMHSNKNNYSYKNMGLLDREPVPTLVGSIGGLSKDHQQFMTPRNSTSMKMTEPKTVLRGGIDIIAKKIAESSTVEELKDKLSASVGSMGQGVSMTGEPDPLMNSYSVSSVPIHHQVENVADASNCCEDHLTSQLTLTSIVQKDEVICEEGPKRHAKLREQVFEFRQKTKDFNDKYNVQGVKILWGLK